jgi:hypothetical protein
MLFELSPQPLLLIPLPAECGVQDEQTGAIDPVRETL